MHEHPPKSSALKSNRGFASMSLERQREIAANGGRALRPDMRAFSKNRELAAAAGRKGGAARKPRIVSVKGDADV